MTRKGEFENIVSICNKKMEDWTAKYIHIGALRIYKARTSTNFSLSKTLREMHDNERQAKIECWSIVTIRYPNIEYNLFEKIWTVLVDLQYEHIKYQLSSIIKERNEIKPIN